MVSLTVDNFISALGTKVTKITYDTSKNEGVTLSQDGFTANIKNVAINGKFERIDWNETIRTSYGSIAKVIPHTTIKCFPASLIEADLRDLNTTGLTSMSHMFNGCSSLISLNVIGLISDNVTDTTNMFNGCQRLKKINLSTLNTSKVSKANNMFGSCSSMKITIGNKYTLQTGSNAYGGSNLSFDKINLNIKKSYIGNKNIKSLIIYGKEYVLS